MPLIEVLQHDPSMTISRAYAWATRERKREREGEREREMEGEEKRGGRKRRGAVSPKSCENSFDVA